MAKKAPEPKTAMICAQCGIEFTGTKCPECGNTKGNTVLAPDGIPIETHAASAAFGTASGLRPTSEALSEEYLMSRELAQGQREELHDNLRESFLIKSKLKKLELEATLRDKKAELSPPSVPRAAAPEPQPQPMQMPNPFQPNTMNPQAQFMNHFMKMGVEDRTEFLDQLAEADPQALSTLSGFFTQQQPMMQQQMPMNPYGMPPGNPYMQYPPPYMQQQQPEQQMPAKDPTETAMSMVDKLQEMSERVKNKEPSELSGILNAMREDQKVMNERLEAMTAERRNTESDALSQRMGQLENKVFIPQQQPGLKEKIHEIKEMVTDLQSIGMMSKPESSNTVDEQIKLSQANHLIKKEDREIELQQQQVDEKVAKAELNKSLVAGMFKRHLHNELGQPGTEAPPPAVSSYMAQPPVVSRAIPDTPKEAVIVEEFSSDAGVVRETIPASRSEEGEYCKLP